MNRAVWYLVFLLVIAHHDFWYWDKSDTVLGMPIGLAYHIALSIGVAVFWALVCVFAWPQELEETDLDSEGGKQ